LSETQKKRLENFAQDNNKGFKEILPVYKNTPAPVYPKFAKKRGYEGTTVIEVLIEIDGKVKDIKINKSAGYEILDNAAINAVKKWLFVPATIGDKKIEMWVKIPVKFEIKD